MKRFTAVLAASFVLVGAARADVVESYNLNFTVTEGTVAPIASFTYDATTARITSLVLSYGGTTFDLTAAANAPASAASRCGNPTGFEILTGQTLCASNQLFFVGQYTNPAERIASLFASDSTYNPDVGSLYTDAAIESDLAGSFVSNPPAGVRSEGTFTLSPSVAAVAEPGSIALLGIGYGGLLLGRRRATRARAGSRDALSDVTIPRGTAFA